MSLEDVFLELTDDSGKAARRNAEKSRERTAETKECEKECEQKQTKRLSKRLKKKAQMQRNQPAETKQEEETHNVAIYKKKS